MDSKFKSIIGELCDYVPHKTRDHFIETRAQQVIASFGHLRKLIEETYDEETADDLVKRLFNAARSGDERKFSRGIKTVMEGKKNNGQNI